jgi:hypothetical protein
MGSHCPKKISGPHRDWLVQRCQERKFTLRGLIAELAERGLRVSYKTVWDFVHEQNLSYKKNHSGRRTGTSGRRAQAPAVAKISRQVDPARLVFIDETPAFAGAGSGPKPIWLPCVAGRQKANG